MALVFEDPADVPPLDTDEAQGVANPAQLHLQRDQVHRARRSARLGNRRSRRPTRSACTCAIPALASRPRTSSIIFQEFGQVAHRLQGRVKGTGPRPAPGEEAGRAARWQDHASRARQATARPSPSRFRESIDTDEAGRCRSRLVVGARTDSGAAGGGRSGRCSRASSVCLPAPSINHCAHVGPRCQARSCNQYAPRLSCSISCCWATRAGGCCCELRDEEASADIPLIVDVVLRRSTQGNASGRR